MKLIFLTFLLCGQICFAEYTYLKPFPILQDSLITNSNSNENSGMYKLKLENPFYYKLNNSLPLEFYSQSFNYNLSFSENLLPYEEGSEKEILQLSQLQLSKAMQMNYSFIKKNDLGAFGKILGAAVGATAVGLGAYHLIKYKKEYFK